MYFSLCLNSSGLLVYPLLKSFFLRPKAVILYAWLENQSIHKTVVEILAFSCIFKAGLGGKITQDQWCAWFALSTRFSHSLDFFKVCNVVHEITTPKKKKKNVINIVDYIIWNEKSVECETYILFFVWFSNQHTGMHIDTYCLLVKDAMVKHNLGEFRITFRIKCFSFSYIIFFLQVICLKDFDISQNIILYNIISSYLLFHEKKWWQSSLKKKNS